MEWIWQNTRGSDGSYISVLTPYVVIIGEHIQLKIGKPGQVCWSASLTVIINFEYVHCTIVENKCFRFQHTKMLLVQSQKWKQKNHLWNLFKVNDRYQNDVNDVALVFLLLTLSRFHTFSGISTVDIKLVKTDWEISVVQKLTRSYQFTKANVNSFLPNICLKHELAWKPMMKSSLWRDFF